MALQEFTSIIEIYKILRDFKKFFESIQLEFISSDSTTPHAHFGLN